MSRKPLGFVSYRHSDNVNDRITEVRTFLEKEVTVALGQRFEIFQDAEDIRVGEKWQSTVRDKQFA